MLIVRGANYPCYELEDAVGALAGVATARVAATSVRDEALGTEAVMLFFVPSEPLALSALPHLHQDGVLIDALRRTVVTVRTAVSSAFGLTPRHAIPVCDESFPRTTSGKIMRSALRAAFLRGDFDRACDVLDLGLDQPARFAFPDYFAAPTWLPSSLDTRPVTDTMARTVLLLAPPPLLDGLSHGLSLVGEVVVGDPSTGWQSMRTALHKHRPTHIVHAMLLCACGADGRLDAQSSETDVAAARASLAIATLLDVARAMQSWISRGSSGRAPAPTLLCVRYDSNDADAAVGYEAGGAAMASSLCKALASELPSIARAAAVHVPRESTAKVTP